MYQCPKCGESNDVNWPVTVNGVIADGGCQMCWETESSECWFEFVTSFLEVAELTADLREMNRC